MAIAFGASLLVSVAILLYMAQKNYSDIDANYWMIVILTPIVIMGYWLKTQVQGIEAAKVLCCFIYLDSTFLISAVLFAMMHALGLQARGWMKALVYGAASVHVALVCLGVHSNLYYESMTIVPTVLGNATKMTSGPLKVFHYAFLTGLLAWFAGIVLVSVVWKGTYSRRSFMLFGVFIGVGLVLHAAEGLMDANFTALPFLYVASDFVIAMYYDYVHTHDIAYVLASQQKQFGTRGYVAIGADRTFQSCNSKAAEFLPFLASQRVDDVIMPHDEGSKLVLELAANCDEKGSATTYYRVGERDYACEMRPYSLKRHGGAQGYLLDIRDATEEVRSYRIVTDYNATLSAEVQEKTSSIQEMQRKIVLGMANMIENRDDNTGGHVKRTSDIIHILVDEIIRQGTMPISSEMARDIVRAAPTHDLGKITIDSNILNKPGRFTDEEYAIMKTHAAKSGELVLILLDGVEEERFVRVAYNVARFHHERWDGRGYPEGLVGTMIPLEARIMAVADVYDALVSKRVYKDAFAHDTAIQMIKNGDCGVFSEKMLYCLDKASDELNGIIKARRE